MNVGPQLTPAPSEPLAKAQAVERRPGRRVRLPAWHTGPRTQLPSPPASWAVWPAHPARLRDCGRQRAGEHALGLRLAGPGDTYGLSSPKIPVAAVPQLCCDCCGKNMNENRTRRRGALGHPVLPGVRGGRRHRHSLVPLLIPRARGLYSATEREPQRGASRARQTEGNGNTNSVNIRLWQECEAPGSVACARGSGMGEQVGVAW